MSRSVLTACVFALAAGVLAGAVTAPPAAKTRPAATGPALSPACPEPVEVAEGPALPPGYKLLYEQNFDKPAGVGDFRFSDPKQWKLAGKGRAAALDFGGGGRYRPKVRSPHIIGLIADRVFEDFILEADLLQTGKEYAHRDMCLFFGFSGKSRFYYCHIASRADNHAHNIFIVNDKPRIKIATKTTRGVDWGKGKWHKVRLERKASDGTIKVFFDDMTTPIMEANDKTFKSGCVGFGSFDDSGRIDNVRIWGPKVRKKKSAFFKKKPPRAGGRAPEV